MAAGGFKSLVVVMQAVAILATLSGAFAHLSPSEAPGPSEGAGYSLQISTAAVASAVIVSLMALIKN